MPSPTILIKNDPAAVALAGAELFIEIATRSIEERGQFSVALSGGSTPAALYLTLSGDRYRDVIDWKRVFFFFGDERNVPIDSPESNYRMARETLFDRLTLHGDSVRRWETEFGSFGTTAEHYELELEHFFRGFPVFDLILLGLGADGHTASLFPETSALRNRDDLAVANWVSKLNDYRFTLTLPVINSARNVVFIVFGREKAEVVRNVLEGDTAASELPAAMVRPESGNLYWLMDKSAARLLRQGQ